MQMSVIQSIDFLIDLEVTTCQLHVNGLPVI